jgi:hypothetical protein
MEFDLPYYVQNGGDGSVIVRFQPTLDLAEYNDSEMSEGWGESSANTVKLKVEDNKLYFREFAMVNGKYDYVWTEVTGG